MHKYCLEFILTIKDVSADIIRNSIVEFGDNLEVVTLPDCNSRQELKIKINTEDPAIIFDTCSQFGRLKSVKID